MTPLLPFLLLALSICAVWLRPLPTGRKTRLPLWLPLFACALASGLAAGVLQRQAVLAAIVLLALAAMATHRRAPRALRTLCGVLCGLLALALALHRVPGFSNPLLLDGVVLSPGAEPLSLYANFDKGMAGLVLLALCCRRVHSGTELIAVLRRVLPCLAFVLLSVLPLAMAWHVLRFDPKLPPVILVFLPVNLFFVVVAEEAFFRGGLQQGLATALSGVRGGAAGAALASALLFGVAHLGGGVAYAGLATLAGLGYACAWSRSHRIEGAMAAHFVFNVVHFLGFTYPRMQMP